RGGRPMDGLWEKTSERVRDTLGQVGYETWICPLNFLGLKGRTATIEAPNRFFRDWVQDRYFEVLQKSLAAEVGEDLELKITVCERNSSGAGHGEAPAAAPTVRPVRTERSEERRDRLAPNHLNSRYTFN